LQARLWSTDFIYPLRIFAGHLSDVHCVKFHPNSNYIATGSSDRSCRLWDVQSGECVRVLEGHSDAVHALAFSEDGRYLATGGKSSLQLVTGQIKSDVHVTIHMLRHFWLLLFCVNFSVFFILQPMTTLLSCGISVVAKSCRRSRVTRA